jgi:hypothetical protein
MPPKLEVAGSNPARHTLREEDLKAFLEGAVVCQKP